MSQALTINNVVLSYPNLFVPRVPKGSTDPKYSCSLILPPTFDWAPLMAAFAEGWAAKFPTVAMPDVSTLAKSPFGVMEDGPYAGSYYLKTGSSADKPPTVVLQNPNMRADAQHQSQFFPGALVNVQVRVFGYDHGTPGLSIGLNMVQLNRSDDSLPRLDNAQSPTEVFETIPGGPVATAQQPMAAPVAQPQMAAPAMAAPVPAMVAPAMVQPVAQPMAQPPVAGAPPVAAPMAQPAMAQPPVAQPQFAGGPPVAQPGQPAVAVGAPGTTPWNQ